MSDNSNTSTASTDSNYCYSVCTCSGTCCCNCNTSSCHYTITYIVPPPRRIIVSDHPEWDKAKKAGWIDLINQKTRTGWIIEMSFSGPVEIHDPNIERRTFDEMLALILWRASETDKALINEFVKTA